MGQRVGDVDGEESNLPELSPVLAPPSGLTIGRAAGYSSQLQPTREKPLEPEREALGSELGAHSSVLLWPLWVVVSWIPVTRRLSAPTENSRRNVSADLLSG